jgi:hypothetical protein
MPHAFHPPKQRSAIVPLVGVDQVLSTCIQVNDEELVFIAILFIPFMQGLSPNYFLVPVLQDAHHAGNQVPFSDQLSALPVFRLQFAASYPG